MFSVVIKREQSHEMIKKVWSKVVQSIIQVVFWTHMTFRKRKQKIKFCIVFNTQLTQWKFFKFPRVFWSIALRIKYPYSEFFWSEFRKIWTRKTPNTDTFHTV